MPAILIAYMIIGFSYSGPFLMISLIIFLFMFRLCIRISSGSWVTKHEWIFGPAYLSIIVAIWWWLRMYDGIFIFAFFLALFTWMMLIHRSMMAR